MYVSVEVLKTKSSRILLQIGCVSSSNSETLHIAFAPTESLTEKSEALLSKLHLLHVKDDHFVFVLKDGRNVGTVVQREGLARLGSYIFVL